MMQAELLRCLQLAIEFENAELDVAKLQDDAVGHRRDVLSALDELRSRVLQQAPPLQQAPAQSVAMFSQMVPTHQPNSIPNTVLPRSPASGSLPAGVTMPEEAEEEGGGRMSRLFSIRGRPHKRSSTSSSSAIQHMVVAPNLDWLGSVQTEPEKYELAAEDVQRQEELGLMYGDVKIAVPEPDTELLHPALAKQSSIARHASTSTRSSDHSNHTRSSTFSDEKIPVVDEDEESTFPDAAEVAAALPPALPPAPLSVRPRQSYISSASAGSHFGSTIMSPTDTVASGSPLPSPAGITPDYSPHSFWFPQNSLTSNGPNLPIPSRERSNTASSGTTSSYHDSLIHQPSLTSNPSSTSTAQTAVLVGRPEKKNNYWGFCKGSWTIREDWRKGLVTQVIPSGMFGQQSVWQCKHCCFRGSIFGAKKPYTTDPNIHEDAETGIRYRWIFLAKCHTKVRIVARAGEGGFGCLFCSLESVHTGVYGSEALLFKHIVDEHAPQMSDGLAARANCVIGRKADAKEGFDINIV
jgi:hypothetical protein